MLSNDRHTAYGLAQFTKNEIDPTNKVLEEKITGIYAAKNDDVLEKYNPEAITKFIKDKLTNLNNTCATSDLERKRVLMCWIFPKVLT